MPLPTPNSSTNKVRKASSGSRPVVTSLASAKTAGSTTAALQVATGWPTDTAVDVVIYRKDTSNNPVAGSQTDWVAELSGTTLNDMVLRAGTEPVSGYAADALTVVKVAPTAAWADDLAEAWYSQHKEDGSHDEVTADSLAVSGAATFTGTVALPSGTVTNDDLSTAAGELGAAWATWTPTWTGLTTTNAAISARYQQTGKTVRFRLALRWTGAPSISGAVGFSLPVTAMEATGQTQGYELGQVIILDFGSAIYKGYAAYDTSTTANVRVMGAAGTYVNGVQLSSTVPMTWANTDEMTITGQYEAA